MGVLAPGGLHSGLLAEFNELLNVQVARLALWAADDRLGSSDSAARRADRSMSNEEAVGVAASPAAVAEAAARGAVVVVHVAAADAVAAVDGVRRS